METTNQPLVSTTEGITASQVQIIEARQKAEFAMTPVGQMLEKFKAQQRIAAVYANSSLIPATLKGDPSKEPGNTPQERALAAYNKTLANCVIALNMASRMKADPLMVMQNLYIVYGQPSFSSKFLIASINASGRYAPLQYEMVGTSGQEDFGCRVVSFAADDTKKKNPLVGPTVTIRMANMEGWTKKNGSKWLTMPEVMLRYRAAAFWQRQFCPEISMGLSTAEEAVDMGPQQVQYAEEVNDNSLDNVAALAMRKHTATKSDKSYDDCTGVSKPLPEAAPNAVPEAAPNATAVPQEGRSTTAPKTAPKADNYKTIDIPQPSPQGNPLEDDEPSLL